MAPNFGGGNNGSFPSEAFNSPPTESFTILHIETHDCYGNARSVHMGSIRVLCPSAIIFV